MKYYLQYQFPSGVVIWYRSIGGTFNMTANRGAATGWATRGSAEAFLSELRQENIHGELVHQLKVVPLPVGDDGTH